MTTRGARSAAQVSLTLAIACATGGCYHDRVYEIDARNVENFNWSGKLRVTMRHKDAFLLSPSDVDLKRIELVGREDESVVVGPVEKSDHEMLVATVESRSATIKEILHTMIQRLDGEEVRYDPGDLARTSEALSAGRFNEINAVPLALLAARVCPEWSARFHYGDDRWIYMDVTASRQWRIRVETDAGELVHQFEMEFLPVTTRQANQ